MRGKFDRTTFFSSLRVCDGYILIASFQVKFSSILSLYQLCHDSQGTLEFD